MSLNGFFVLFIETPDEKHSIMITARSVGNAKTFFWFGVVSESCVLGESCQGNVMNRANDGEANTRQRSDGKWFSDYKFLNET